MTTAFQARLPFHGHGLWRSLVSAFPPLSTTTSLGVSIIEEQATHGPAQRTHDCLPGVFAGLSDGLVEEIGGTPTPATGFAVGLERIVALMQSGDNVPTPLAPHAYLLAVGVEAQRAAHTLAEQLRDALPSLCLLVDAGPGHFKRKMKTADRSDAKLALILGEDEIREQRITLKDMRGDGGQMSVARSEIAEKVRASIGFND